MSNALSADELWSEISGSAEYGALSGADKARVRRQFFESHLAPRLGEVDRSGAFREFEARVASRPTEVPYVAAQQGLASAPERGLVRVQHPASRGLSVDWDRAGADAHDLLARTPIGQVLNAAGTAAAALNRRLFGPSRVELEEKQLRDLRDMHELAIKYRMQGT